MRVGPAEGTRVQSGGVIRNHFGGVIRAGAGSVPSAWKWGGKRSVPEALRRTWRLRECAGQGSLWTTRQPERFEKDEAPVTSAGLRRGARTGADAAALLYRSERARGGGLWSQSFRERFDYFTAGKTHPWLRQTGCVSQRRRPNISPRAPALSKKTNHPPAVHSRAERVRLRSRPRRAGTLDERLRSKRRGPTRRTSRRCFAAPADARGPPKSSRPSLKYHSRSDG
ncbi:hypothetical protein AAFF_G00352520 [Aldrovandia affinis]|uniref:Uncharacterized protein n=1 Tax=Aldrovandia affinis TaxID=143900 RepID=A0AAD7SJH6_9TELE|nr:hypothetical protein AAFF_G00352520 [Aldrovandia affinis]